LPPTLPREIPGLKSETWGTRHVTPTRQFDLKNDFNAMHLY